MIKSLCCSAPDCKKIVRIRGLCQSHYRQLQQQVLHGVLTWAQAVDQGLCLPAQPTKVWMNTYYKEK